MLLPQPLQLPVMETAMVMALVLVLVLVYLDRALWRVRFSNKNPHPNLEFQVLAARWTCKALGEVPVLGVGGVCYLGDVGGV